MLPRSMPLLAYGNAGNAPQAKLTDLRDEVINRPKPTATDRHPLMM